MKDQILNNKALLILPLLLLPFVVLIFYILGGAEQAELKAEEKNSSEAQNGMNYQLPQAERSIEIYDKMEAYQKQGEIIGQELRLAQNKEEGLMENEDILVGMEADSLPEILKEEPEQVPAKLLAHIRQKELQVQAEMQNETKPPKKAVIRKASPSKTQRSNSTQQAKEVKAKELESIEELEQIFEVNAQLERRNDSLRYFLSHAEKELQEIKDSKRNVFQLESQSKPSFNADDKQSLLIKAEVYEDAVLLDGNRVKLRLLQEYWIAGRKVKKNTFVYGICKLNKERLLIQISQFPIQGGFLPVDLQVHDLDGLPGLYIPDRAARKVTREVGAQTNFSPLLGRSQDALTNIGITTADRTAQTLIRRVRLKKVRLMKNSVVYIINQKQ